MQIINITNPGVAPVDGDWVEYHHDSGSIERKEYHPIAAPSAPVDPCKYLIDIGPFFDRFGAYMMAVLTSQDAVVKAIVQNVTVRKWVDLTRVDVAQSLDLFISKGLMDAPTKTAILTNPVTLDENRALRKQYF